MLVRVYFVIRGEFVGYTMEYLFGKKDLLFLAYLFRTLYKKLAALMRIEWVPDHSILPVIVL